ncbi:hypothetical protein L195_g040440, partial [Trifolium pratense]
MDGHGGQEGENGEATRNKGE